MQLSTNIEMTTQIAESPHPEQESFRKKIQGSAAKTSVLGLKVDRVGNEYSETQEKTEEAYEKSKSDQDKQMESPPPVESVGQSVRFHVRPEVSESIQILPTVLRKIESISSSLSPHPLSSDTLKGQEREEFANLGQAHSAFRQSLDPSRQDSITSLDREKYDSNLHQAMAAARPFIKQGLDTRDCGSKWDRLIQMHSLQEVLQTPNFSIPKPIGIRSPVILTFLTKHAPKALEDWNDLCRIYQAQEQHEKLTFLQQEKVILTIQQIEACIIDAFNNAAKDPASYPELALLPSLKLHDSEGHHTDHFLMVRSTGAEDEKTAANAGGNKSVDYVPPTQQEIMQAIGPVVASYFSVKSLKNRLNSGKNPFQDPIQSAIFVQQLIGEALLEKETEGPERNPQSIPSSFVCFSCEPLWVGQEKFRTMCISATFGHGEGVVGERGIPTDFWIILISEVDPHRLYIIPKIRNKSMRLAPVGSQNHIKLEKVKNPPEIAKTPSLSQEQLYGIFANAVNTEVFFDEGALDIEGVCKGGVIHFVQARPVTRQPVQAHYFDTAALNQTQKAALVQSAQVKPLVPGHCNVVEITEKDQLLVAETLDDALEDYNPEKHRLVIVHEHNPGLSHAYVTFSALGVPCLVEPNRINMAEITRQIDPTSPLLACTQKAQLYLWDRRKADPQECIKKSFGKHPAKITPSSLSRSLHLEEPREVLEDLQALFLRLRHPEHAVALAALEALEKHPAITAIQQTRLRYEKEFQQYPNLPPKVLKIVHALKEYDSSVSEAFVHTKRVFSKFNEHLYAQNRLQCLFYAEVLEGTLLESHKEPGAVGRCNVMCIERMSQAIDLIIHYQKTLTKMNSAFTETPAYFADLLMDVKKIPNADPEIFENWQEFLLNLEIAANRKEISPEEIDKFKKMIKTIRKLGVFPRWFLFFFPYSNQQATKECSIESFKSLLAQYDLENASFQKLMDISFQVNHMSEMQEQFANPKTFQQAWKELHNIVNKITESPEIFNRQSPYSLEGQIAHQTMERLVTVFDSSIKIMKMSRKFSENEKTQLFKEMLIPFHRLLKSWSSWKDGQYSKLIVCIGNLLQNIPDNDPEQLRSYPGFSCNFFIESYSKNQCVDDREWYFKNPPSKPRTLEDIFTTTHQTFLKTLLLPLPESWEKTSHLPISVKQGIRELQQNHFPCIGLNVTEDEIIYRSFRSFQVHCAQIDLVYKKATQQMTLNILFTGEDFGNRWDSIKRWVNMLDANGILQLDSRIKHFRNDLSFSWKINTHTQTNNLSLVLSQLSELIRSSSDWKDGFTKRALPTLMHALQEEGVQDVQNKLALYSFRHPEGFLYSIAKDYWLNPSLRCQIPPQIILEFGIKLIEKHGYFYDENVKIIDIFSYLMDEMKHKKDYPIHEQQIQQVLFSRIKNFSLFDKSKIFDIFYGKLEDSKIEILPPTEEELTSNDEIIRAQAERRLIFLQRKIKAIINSNQNPLDTFPLDIIKYVLFGTQCYLIIMGDLNLLKLLHHRGIISTNDILTILIHGAPRLSEYSINLDEFSQFIADIWTLKNPDSKDLHHMCELLEKLLQVNKIELARKIFQFIVENGRSQLRIAREMVKHGLEEYDEDIMSIEWLFTNIEKLKQHDSPFWLKSFKYPLEN